MPTETMTSETTEAIGTKFLFTLYIIHNVYSPQLADKIQ